jgi:hypothetical protein
MHSLTAQAAVTWVNARPPVAILRARDRISPGSLEFLLLRAAACSAAARNTCNDNSYHVLSLCWGLLSLAAFRRTCFVAAFGGCHMLLQG